jgi:spore germination cell wall hydrolase CwlJ-like protein
MMTEALCLATAIFFEARDQPIDGQLAVAEVVLNRVEHKRWPDTICAVVFEPKQFSFTHDGMSDNPERYRGHQDRLAWATSQEVAEDALEGRTMGLTATHYHTHEVSPAWAKVYPKEGAIGDHVFYTCTKGKC